MEILFRLLYGVSEEKQDVIIARVRVDIRKQAIPNTNMGNYPWSKLFGVLYFVDRASCNDSWEMTNQPVHSQPAHDTATNTEWQLPEVVLTQFVSPDDEHDVPETCREFLSRLFILNLCLNLRIVCYRVFQKRHNEGVLDLLTVPSHFFDGPPSPLVGKSLLIIEASRSHSDTPHLVGLLWTSDRPEAETLTTQILARDRHPSPRRDSNPASKCPEPHALDRAATGVCQKMSLQIKFIFTQLIALWLY